MLKGFTLIGLMMVVSILGILAGVTGHVNTKKLDYIFEDIDGNMNLSANATRG